MTTADHSPTTEQRNAAEAFFGRTCEETVTGVVVIFDPDSECYLEVAGGHPTFWASNDEALK